MKKIKIARFVGRQLSRLKAGQSYYSMGMFSLIAIGTLKAAFPRIDTLFIIILVISMLLGAIFIGYFMDKKNIITYDYKKSVEMNHRFLNKMDEKNNEFRIIQTRIMLNGFKAIQEGKPLDFDELEKEYKEYNEKWNPPEKNGG